MTALPILPYDIICKIVVDLSEDINTLLNLAIVSKSWNEEATRALYSSSPNVKLRVTSSMSSLRLIRFMQVINNSQCHANMVHHFAWTISQPYNQAYLEYILRAVGRMKNLTSLDIRQPSNDSSIKDVIPHLILPDSISPYQLKKLTWSCTRLPATIYQLCNIIAFHCHTLEDISLNFQTDHLPALETHDDRRQLIGQLKAFRELNVNPPQTRFPHLPPSQVLWPLARLHTLRGSQEALDTVLEVAAKLGQIQKFDVITPAGSEFLQPVHGSPNPDVFLCRLVAFLQVNPLKIFNVDLARNLTLKLEELIPHLSSIEEMTIHLPSNLVGSATSMPMHLLSISSLGQVHDVSFILNKFIQNPRPTLLFLAITKCRIHLNPSGHEPDNLTDIFSGNRRVVRRLFSSCATLAQFRMEVFDADHVNEYSQYVKYSRRPAFSKGLQAGQTTEDSRKVQIKRESGKGFV